LLVETESLASALLILTFILFVILMVALFLANNWVSKKIWNPFYRTLENIKQFRVSQTTSISFQDTNINEFKELNFVIGNLTERLRNDFNVLKEFTENTSHELQTPLAIIKSKLELLMQADNLTDSQYTSINTSYSTVNKLSKLNEALGLLTKIENSQFVNTESIDLCLLIKNKISTSGDLLNMKSVKVTKNNCTSFYISMNPTLADILIENLINNSIKHNVQNGSISIDVIKNEIRISNTGNPLSIDPISLFQRFSKFNSQSFGLGLSIVKGICNQSNIEINYQYRNNWHFISLKFRDLIF